MTVMNCFCFSCKHFCSLLHCSLSWVPLFRRFAKHYLLLATENYDVSMSSSLPLVEQWKEYVVLNHSSFPAIEEKVFLSGTRLMAALDKVGSQYLRKEFRRDTRRFLEEIVNCILSTVASRSVIAKGMSCFFPAIVVGGVDVAPFQLFNKLLVGLLE